MTLGSRFEANKTPLRIGGVMLGLLRRCLCGTTTKIAGIIFVFLAASGRLGAQQEPPVELLAPKGFEVTRFAGDALAHDIHSMTIDASGRIVVSGPGYVKILVDHDGDGRADFARDYADGPATGAQGMYFMGRDLLCTGDEGLIRFQDKNGDDRADGPPETFLKIKTGSEHHAHAVRRGPDGWWYVIAGNFSEVTSGYATDPASPVRNPRGGVLLRLKPDLSGGEILADGFRNAYDFDFDIDAELFAYDSDGERDVSLPWYLPTRLFHVVPGGNHGWFTENWKRPDGMLDSPVVLASTGRGSPTGVVCYQHTQFPQAYRGALFALDWTFGRVWLIPRKRQGASFAPQKPVPFITAKGEHGFAPTDAEIGIDGSLYISVGGRGTQGGVYRVSYSGPGAGSTVPALFQSTDRAAKEQQLRACLEVQQPQSSWARPRWVALAKKLGMQPFLSTALDEQLPSRPRVRAIQILTDLFDGLPASAVEILSAARAPEVRAAAAWSVGCKQPRGMQADQLVSLLSDSEPVVRRRALEAAARLSMPLRGLEEAIARCLDSADHQVRVAAARLVARLPAGQVKQVADLARQAGWKASLFMAVGYAWRHSDAKDPYNAYAVDIARRVLAGKHPLSLKRDAARLLQIAVGDLGGRPETSGVLQAYCTAYDLLGHESDLDAVRIALADAFPADDASLNLELARAIAMLAVPNASLRDRLLDRITSASSPVDDLHYLIAAARIPVELDAGQSGRVADALINLDAKIQAAKLERDSNWDDRVDELYAELVSRDPELPGRLVNHASFGRPGHVLFLSKCSDEEHIEAVARFVKAIKEDPDYVWTSDMVFAVGSTSEPENLRMVRQLFENFELRMAVLMVLADEPEEQDRELFAAGLELGALEVITACVEALEKLPAARNGVELASLARLLRRLGAETPEYELRERVVKLLERNSGERFEFVFGNAGHVPQSAAIEKWTEWVAREFPKEAQEHLGAASADLESLRKRLATVPWESGNLERGRKLFTSRACAQCHGGGRGLGPDLAGVAGRFSREDLFVAIALPNRDVSPRYQTVLVETKSGKTLSGMVVYESVDGLMLRNGANQTFRIEAAQIGSKRGLATSLMPEGLLNDLKDSDLADLYAYLKGLGARTAARPVETSGEPSTK
jgi:putative membrane-bound dehydrogenase-like protein